MGNPVTAAVSTLTGGGLRAVDNILGTRMSGGNAYSDALDAQTGATGQANQAISNAYGEQKKYLNPYFEAGNRSMSQLASGNLVNATTLANDQGYQARLNEGLKAVNMSAAAKGGLNSGATLKALTRYGQDYASNEYDKAYNREYSRLSQLAGYGNSAANNLASVAGSYGSNLSNNYMGLGNAAASSNIAQANNQMQLINGLTGATGYALGRRG